MLRKAPLLKKQKRKYTQKVRTPLTRKFPERADELFAKAEETAIARYEHLARLGDLYSQKA